MFLDLGAAPDVLRTLKARVAANALELATAPASDGPLAAGVGRWYDATTEAAMIEPAEEQFPAPESAEAAPRVEEYDDSPWTREELQALAWEVGEQSEWEEYDDPPEKP